MTIGTLDECLAHCDAIYGQRNARVFRGRGHLLAFLGDDIREITVAERKRQYHLFPKLLSSSFARWCAVVNRVLKPGESMALIMASKWGQECPYCLENPCNPAVCTATFRPAVQIRPPPSDRKLWLLSDLQNHLGTLYGKRNSEEGLTRIVSRLSGEEFIEADVAWALCKLPEDAYLVSAEIRQRDLLLELCDILAWLIAVANESKIPLENAVQDRYGNGCPTCHFRTCDCKEFDSNYVGFRPKI